VLQIFFLKSKKTFLFNIQQQIHIFFFFFTAIP